MKPILVFYIDVGNTESDKVQDFINNTIEKVKDDTQEVIKYFIPVRGEGTRVECIYPKFLVVDNTMREEMESLHAAINQLSHALVATDKNILPS